MSKAVRRAEERYRTQSTYGETHINQHTMVAAESVESIQVRKFWLYGMPAARSRQQAGIPRLLS